MKKVAYLLSAVLVLSLSTAAFAMKMKGKGSDAHITGKITHVDKDMYTVTDGQGKEHMLHVDKTTKTDGDLNEGAEVEAEAASSGHAKSIVVKKEGDKK